MKRHLISIFLIAALVQGIFAASDNLSMARSLMSQFRTQASTTGLNSSAYRNLYEATQCYMRAIDGKRSTDPEYQECKTALLEIFPRIADGAYFYASQGNQDEVLKYACAYVDISILPCMGDENLMSSPRYGILANLAATNLYNRRQYDRSIRYFQAYLESGDVSARENAFEGLARCFHEQGLYGQAANICHQASKFFPSNWNILIVGIESAGRNGNDDEMGDMLDLALRINPSHGGLLEYKGKLCERRRDYEQAAKIYERICSSPGATLDNFAHLGFDYYNAGTLAYTRAKESNNQTGIIHARSLFNKAIPNLQTVLNNTPSATNVARALAFCHSMNQDATRLEEVNRKLQAMNAPKVNFDALPTINNNYTPSHEIIIDNYAQTLDIAHNKKEEIISDVDKDIPNTGFTNDKTLAVIIANENYTKVSSNVNFALRDGEKMKEYCNKVLGIPERNISYETDISFKTIESCINKIKGLTDKRPDQYNVIFYFAGHGQRGTTGEDSYLLPFDSDGMDKNNMYSLNKLYSDFDNMKAKRVMVFLDACFSGGRDGKSLFDARYVASVAPSIEVTGKTVVFSAADGAQFANSYKEKGHGYFTYFLLKALKESNGRITLADLGKKLQDNVSFEVQLNLNAEQTPVVRASEGLGSTWESKTLLD